MHPTYSPTPFLDYPEMSNVPYSDQYRTPDTDITISDDDEENVDDYAEEKQADNTEERRLKRHRDIEKRRRETEAERFDELSSLITNWHDVKSSKIPQLGLLKIAADLLNQINSRHQQDPLLPSYLTKDEVNFLKFETNNTFLFVTTVESSSFHIIHVTDSIQRILGLSSEQWVGQDFLSLIHPDDLFHVHSQLIALTRQIDKQTSIKCRLQQGNSSYSSVIIDGTIKKIDSSLNVVSADDLGYFAFIGLCQLPLINQYNEQNMSLYKNPNSLLLSCRCSPTDWKIFLVDCSVSTFPSISFNLFRDKSILDFIHPDDQPSVHRALINSTVTLQDELITCRFMCSSTEILTMILEIKPFVNRSNNRINFIELIFKNINDLIKDSNYGDV